jgi:hypothetical protein
MLRPLAGGGRARFHRIRVAFWFDPEIDYTAEHVATRHAEFAIELVS